jgi:hypothetical protein
MKTLKFVMFLFYQYYSTGSTHRIPYFSTLCAVVFLAYLHIFQILVILDKVDWLPMQADDEKIIKYGKLAIFLLPVFLILAFLIRERDLKNMNYDQSVIKNGNIRLVAYIVLSFILLFVLMFAFA